jgi:cytochrome c-L
MRWNSNRTSARRHIIAASLLLPVLLAAPVLAIEFRHALDDAPLDLKPIKGEEFTDAVKSFRETGTNPYNGNAEAVAKGKDLFEQNCQACHNSDATGGMGPSLVDDVYANKRANTDVGKFEIIHSGAAGAMRSFADRGVTQDQILHIIAYVNSLKK